MNADMLSPTFQSLRIPERRAQPRRTCAPSCCPSSRWLAGVGRDSRISTSKYHLPVITPCVARASRNPARNGQGRRRTLSMNSNAQTVLLRGTLQARAPFSVHSVRKSRPIWISGERSSRDMSTWSGDRYRSRYTGGRATNLYNNGVCEREMNNKAVCACNSTHRRRPARGSVRPLSSGSRPCWSGTPSGCRGIS